jgi:hypothetical protein
MRIFDFIGQTFMFLLALLCLLMGGEGLVFIAFIQFFIGVWQLISAIMTTAGSDHGDPIRTLMIRIYWGAVIGYFAILTALGLLMKDLAIFWFFCAWLIAIYYYVLVIRIAFASKKEKSNAEIFHT